MPVNWTNPIGMHPDLLGKETTVAIGSSALA
jgi:hypothetical protein